MDPIGEKKFQAFMQKDILKNLDKYSINQLRKIAVNFSIAAVGTKEALQNKIYIYLKNQETSRGSMPTLIDKHFDVRSVASERVGAEAPEKARSLNDSIESINESVVSKVADLEIEERADEERKEVEAQFRRQRNEADLEYLRRKQQDEERKEKALARVRSKEKLEKLQFAEARLDYLSKWKNLYYNQGSEAARLEDRDPEVPTGPIVGSRLSRGDETLEYMEESVRVRPYTREKAIKFCDRRVLDASDDDIAPKEKYQFISKHDQTSCDNIEKHTLNLNENNKELYSQSFKPNFTCSPKVRVDSRFRSPPAGHVGHLGFGGAHHHESGNERAHHSQTDHPSGAKIFSNRVEQDPNLVADFMPQDSFGQMLKCFRELKQGNMPNESDIRKFNSSVKDYPRFLIDFNSDAEELTSDSQRFKLLTKYITGEAKSIVEPFMLIADRSRALRGALRALEKRYSDLNMIVKAFEKEMLGFPDILTKDLKNFDRFTLLLDNYNNLIESCDSKLHQNRDHLISDLALKLPPPILDKWRRLTYKFNQRNYQETFPDFVAFLISERDMAFNPKYLKNAPATVEKKVLTKNAFYVEEKETPKKSSRVCYYCRDCCNAVERLWSTHTMPYCKFFRAKPEYEKMEVLNALRLCFDKSCYSKNCMAYRHRNQGRTPRRVEINHNGAKDVASSVPKNGEYCEKKYEKQEEIPVVPHASANNFSVSENKTNNMVLIPLLAKAKDGRVTKTLGFLDLGSSLNLVKESLVRRLGLEVNQRTPLVVNTIDPNPLKLDSFFVPNISISNWKGDSFYQLSPAYTTTTIPVSGKGIVEHNDIKNYSHLSEIDLPHQWPAGEVEILIGNSFPEAFEPLKILNSKNGSPYGVLTRMGWYVHAIGIKDKQLESHDFNSFFLSPSFRVPAEKITNEKLHEAVVRYYDMEMRDVHSGEIGLSVEEQNWKEQVESSCKYVDGKYSVCLPKRNISIENNYFMAKKQLEGLQKRLMRDSTLHALYKEYVEKLISKGIAVEIPKNEIRGPVGRTNYLPHHAVYGENKKFRVVYNGASKYKGVCINDLLLPGPNFLNLIPDILLRARLGRYIFVSDIELMYYSILVDEKDQDLLRFLFWKGGELDKEPVHYRMTRQPFGCSSSGQIATYCLKRLATDFRELFSFQTLETIRKKSYCDDIIGNGESESELIKLAQQLIALCAKGNFNLRKFFTNSSALIEYLPEEKLKYPEDKRGVNVERLTDILGVNYDVISDTLMSKISVEKHPITKRGILSVVAGIWDPLGIAGPIILKARYILQLIMKEKLTWDCEVPVALQNEWNKWQSEAENIGAVEIQRCLVPSRNKVGKIEFHHFCDGSIRGMAANCFIRIVYESGEVITNFVIGKTRVSPIKDITIVRKELIAAVMASRLWITIKNALELDYDEVYFWTDSLVVLSYIRNVTSKYQIFVTNRLSVVRENTKIDQWKYVNSELNPADPGSRGKMCDKWLDAPPFLKQNHDDFFPVEPIYSGDEMLSLMEIKKEKCLVISIEDDPTQYLLDYFSSYDKLLRAVAWLERYKKFLRLRKNIKSAKFAAYITVGELNKAEDTIVEYIQRKNFSQEIEALKENKHVPSGSPLAGLSPFLDENVVRVGGRLRFSVLPYKTKHPKILPKNTHVSKLIIIDTHRKLAHSGLSHCLVKIREKFWILRANALIRSVLHKCQVCRRQNSRPILQKMADLHQNRVGEPGQIMSEVCIDCFGVYQVLVKRSYVKRYGLIFICLKTRAIHLEVLEDMSTNAFLNALRRMLARRSNVRTIFCDRGTNFMGSREILVELYACIDHTHVGAELGRKGIDFVLGPPQSSRYFGSAERGIRSAKKLVVGLLSDRSDLRLSDFDLSTFFCEVESILNSRPISAIYQSPEEPLPLTPNHFLNLSNEGMKYIQYSDESPLYHAKSWRKIQALATSLWKRWQREYISLLQTRYKWRRARRNLKVGDIVLLVDQGAPRGQWPMGLVTEVKIGADQLVRSVKIKYKGNIVERSIGKLVLFMEKEDHIEQDSLSV